MATIFRNLFRGGKKSKKDDAEEELARQVSNRRSFRAPSACSQKSSSRRMTARFADDGMLSATAAYHTSNAPKLKKGPQSCPGGYREESEGSNNSFDSDKYSTKSGRRRGDAMNQSLRQSYPLDDDVGAPSAMKHSSRAKNHRYVDFRRRGDTSEYGSGDPSPIGGGFGGGAGRRNNHSHYEARLDESENDEFDEKDQIVMMERTNLHYMQRWKESEQKRREERKKFKEIERERNDMQNAMFSYMRQADQLKKEKDKYKAKLRQTEKELNDLRQQHYAHLNFNTPFNFCSQNVSNQLNRSSAFGSGGGGGHHGVIVTTTSNTPTTMNSTGCGAGESLVQPGDMSLLQFQPMSVPMLNLNNTIGSSSPCFKVPSANFGEEDEDEVKNFRSEELTIETARNESKTEQNERLVVSPGGSADSNVTLSELTINKENVKPVIKKRVKRDVEISRSCSIMSI